MVNLYQVLSSRERSPADSLSLWDLYWNRKRESPIFFFFYVFVFRDFPQKMASALSENPASVIHSLNLAHNTLDNQGGGLTSVTSLAPSPSYCRLCRSLLFHCFCSLPMNSKSMSSQNTFFLFLSICLSSIVHVFYYFIFSSLAHIGAHKHTHVQKPTF